MSIDIKVNKSKNQEQVLGIPDFTKEEMMPYIPEYQQEICAHLLKDEAFIQAAMDYQISPYQFNNEAHQNICMVVMQHWNAYKNLPSRAVMHQTIHDRFPSKPLYLDELQALYELPANQKETLTAKLAKFCKGMAFYRSIREAQVKLIHYKNGTEIDLDAEWKKLGDTQQLRTSSKAEFLTMADLFNMPNPEWLIEKHLSRGSFVTLFAPSGNYKSFIAVDMALSIATGTPFLGSFPVKQGKVCYIASEGSSGLPGRVKAWNKERGQTETPNIIFLRKCYNLTEPSIRQKVIDICKQGLNGLPDVIVIDTVSRNFGDGNTNDNQEMQNWCDGLNDWLGLGITVIAIHHAGWNKERERGASNIRDCSDTTIRVLNEDGNAALSCIKQKDAEPFHDYIAKGKPVALDGCTSLVFSYAGENVSKLEKFVQLFPVKEKDSVTFDEFYDRNHVQLEALEIGEGTARNYLTEAKKQGLILWIQSNESRSLRYRKSA